MSGFVHFQDVAKTYRAGTEEELLAVGPVSFDIARDEFVSLLGPSGCGKSTCLRILDGVVRADPGGAAFVDGEEVIRPSFKQARVFQQFVLLPWKTVQTNVELGLKFKGVERSERSVIALQYLELVGLSDFAQTYPNELSGGMQQRVGIARALATDPLILLADEPFGSLDALTRELLQDELLRIWGEAKKTVLFVTHSISEAVYLSDRVLVLSNRPGRLVADIDIQLTRPRRREIKSTPEFIALEREIWGILSDELLKSDSGHRHRGSR